MLFALTECAMPDAKLQVVVRSFSHALLPYRRNCVLLALATFLLFEGFQCEFMGSLSKELVPYNKNTSLVLFKQYAETKDPEIEKRLVVANARLVMTIASGYNCRPAARQDLIQEGYIGLIHGVKRFDLSYNVQFSTYASMWIKAFILRFLMQQSEVRLVSSAEKRRLFFKLRKEQARLGAMGEDDSVHAAALALGAKKSDADEVDMALINQPISIDRSHSLFSDDPARRPDIIVESADSYSKLLASIEEFLGDLSLREQGILRARLLNEDDPPTFRALAPKLGVSYERVRQIEEGALIKLRKRLKDDLQIEGVTT